MGEAIQARKLVMIGWKATLEPIAFPLFFLFLTFLIYQYIIFSSS
jgi:hypothetical protein